MLRIFWILAVSIVAAAAWVSLLRSDLPGNQHILVLLAPLFALVAFGIYSVICLTVGVLTFRTVPEEHESLLKDIAEAKADLIARGVLDHS